MRTLLRVSLAAVVVFSCIWLTVQLVTSLRWKARDYRCVVLTEDLTFRGQGTNLVLGVLKKGTVLFAPTIDDMAVTDPGDIELHKVYVRIPPDVIGRQLLFPPSQAGVHLPKTICNILEVVPISKESTAKDVLPK